MCPARCPEPGSKTTARIPRQRSCPIPISTRRTRRDTYVTLVLHDPAKITRPTHGALPETTYIPTQCTPHGATTIDGLHASNLENHPWPVYLHDAVTCTFGAICVRADISPHACCVGLAATSGSCSSRPALRGLPLSVSPESACSALYDQVAGCSRRSFPPAASA